MPPRKEDIESLDDSSADGQKDFSGLTNAELMADAGKVHMDEAQMWGKGIIKDFRQTVGTHWWKQMTNFNQKTVAVTLLVFISVIAPTLTFGAVYGKVTENRIGTVETILATSWIGCVYALIGGMPLVSYIESASLAYDDLPLYLFPFLTNLTQPVSPCLLL